MIKILSQLLVFHISKSINKSLSNIILPLTKKYLNTLSKIKTFLQNITLMF